MAVETELKLRITPESMEKLKRHPLLKTLAAVPPVTRELHNTYYDTPGLTLQKHAMALRLRRIGGEWLQTLKGGGGVEAGLHSRNEWETPVPNEALDLPAIQAIGGKLPPGAAKKLQPVFATDFTRDIHQLDFEGVSIELGMDSGEIRAGDKTRPISELELELKNGEPAKLFQLALKLLEIVPLEVEHTSKAEYGYRLYTGRQPAVVKAKLPTLEKTQGIAPALRGVIGACLLQIQANVPGALQKLDEEYLHQVRVGLRRLRVALAIARAHRADAELQALRKDLAKLCNELGGAREWDVFVTQTLRAIRKQMPQNTGLRETQRASEKTREKHHAAMQASLASPDFQRLILRIGHWMQGGYWQEGKGQEGKRKESLTAFAASTLEKRAKPASKRGKKLARADAAQLHALRIACKNLRYSAEIFAPLFGEAKTTRYLQSLSALQDTLGALNDNTVARRLLDEMDKNPNEKTRTLILDWLEQEHSAQMAELRGTWKKFAGQGAFWE